MVPEVVKVKRREETFLAIFAQPLKKVEFAVRLADWFCWGPHRGHRS